ncbi:MAG: hypothetical protein KKA73_19560 [Chloroflexi bacterium]|nr:hypothetical protein [Chloroflexota bacterium]MBU1749885.1 hypothetical protein [Chloroflexota bacterium]
MAGRKRIVSAILMLVIMTCLAELFVCAGIRSTRTHLPELVTSPLNPSVARDLCTILEISPDDPRCSDTASPYAFQFFPEIRGRYSPKTSRQIVDQEIGAYLVDCTTVHTFSDGGYVACYYDFRGDGAYKVEIDYAYLYTLDRNVSRERELEDVVWQVCTHAIREESPGHWRTGEICNR